MKKMDLRSLGVVLIMGLGLAVAAGQEAAKPAEAAKAEAVKPAEQAVPLMLKTDQPIKVDGILDEPAWQAAQVVEVKYILGKKGAASKEPRMNVKYLWDDHYLYIGYETFDSNLVAIAEGGKQGPEDNQRQGCAIWHKDKEIKVDVVEFFITFGDYNMFWEIHHNALNQFNDMLVVTKLPAWKQNKPSIAPYDIYFGGQEFIADEGEFKLAMAVMPKPNAENKPSTVNDDKDADTGYVGELRLPLSGLGVPLNAKKGSVWNMENRDMQILAVCQNGDLQDRYHHSAPVLPDGFFHLNASNFPRYKCAVKPNP